MLVLARKRSESIVIGDDVRITIVEIGRGRVQIGIEAPRHIPVRRQELGVRDVDADRYLRELQPTAE